MLRHDTRLGLREQDFGYAILRGMKDEWYTSTTWVKRRQIEDTRIGRTIEAFFPTVILWQDEMHLLITVPSNDDVLEIYERIGTRFSEKEPPKLTFMKDVQPGTEYRYELPKGDKPYGLVFQRLHNINETIIFVHKLNE